MTAARGPPEADATAYHGPSRRTTPSSGKESRQTTHELYDATHRGDPALVVSDYPTGSPARVGSAGAARPRLRHDKTHRIDCPLLVSGLIEPSDYLTGRVHADIRQRIDGIPHADSRRRRTEAGTRAIPRSCPREAIPPQPPPIGDPQAPARLADPLEAARLTRNS